MEVVPEDAVRKAALDTGDADARVRAAEAGIDVLLRKPTGSAALVAAIERGLIPLLPR